VNKYFCSVENPRAFSLKLPKILLKNHFAVSEIIKKQFCFIAKMLNSLPIHMQKAIAFFCEL